MSPKLSADQPPGRSGSTVSPGPASGLHPGGGREVPLTPVPWARVRRGAAGRVGGVSTSSSTRAQFQWPDLLAALSRGEDLSRDMAYWAMDNIMAGEVPDAVIGGFLMALRTKGESTAELNGLADAMVGHARPISVPGPALDIVGTGGDRLSSVNISTMAALVCAGAGARVVKHGNRASSSKSGSADVLEALGVRLDMPVDLVRRCATEVGVTFLFAQTFHPSMRFAAAARKALGVPTAFNFLGPVTNPARVSASAIGVADASLAPLMAGVFQNRGDRALVFRGGDGLDELTVTAPSAVWEVRDGAVTEHTVEPLELDMPRATIADLRGGDAAHNAGVVRDVLDGAPGHVRNAVLLNAAAGLVAVAEDSDRPFAERFEAAVTRAADAVDSGAAREVLERWIAFSAS